MRSTTTATLRGLAAATLTAAVLLGCGGDDDAAPATTAAASADEGTEADGGTASREIIVISGFTYNGPESVPVGTTIEVRNNDSAPHSWTSTDGVFDSGSLAMSETYEFTFDEPGEYSFFCSIHPSMTGTITVTP